MTIKSRLSKLELQADALAKAGPMRWADFGRFRTAPPDVRAVWIDFLKRQPQDFDPWKADQAAMILELVGGDQAAADEIINMPQDDLESLLTEWGIAP